MTRRLLTALLLVLAANALYAPYINRIMMCDEANTLYQYSLNLVRALFSYATPNNHILHSTLVWTVTTFAGTSTVAVRFVALAAALISVALMFRVATRFAGLRAGVAASALLLTALGFAGYAVNARGYTLTGALTLLLIDRLFLTRVIWTRRYRYSLLAISFALTLTLPSMIMLLGAAGLWVIWKARTQRRYRALLLPLIFGVLLAGAFYAPSLLQGEILTQDITLFGETDLLLMLRLWAGEIFGTAGIGLLFVLACAAGIVVLARHYPRARTVIALVVGVTAACALAQYLVTHKVFYARNYLYLVAPLALLGGIGLSRVVRRWTVPLVAALLVLSVIPLRALDGDYIEKDVLARVAQNVGATDQILAGPCFNAPIQYHLLHSDQSEKLFSTPPKQRVFVLYREGTYENVLELYNMQDNVTACQPVSDGSWSPFDVYVCQPLAR